MIWSGQKVLEKCIGSNMSNHLVGKVDKEGKPYVEINGFPAKINPNGIDMPIRSLGIIDKNGIARIEGGFRNWITNANPTNSRLHAGEGFYHVPQGIYIVELAYGVKIPKKAVGLHFPRSSLPRFGVLVSQALYDSGYEGFGTALVNVGIKEFIIGEKEGWFQFTVYDADESNIMYDGHWQKEGMRTEVIK